MATNFKINVWDDWKEAEALKINIWDSWKTVSNAFINIWDSWKEIYSGSTPPNWLLNGLVNYYKADTNWSFPDAHWSADWTIYWATYTASGKINWCYDFDGSNDYITHPGPDLTNLWSFSFWIEPDNAWTWLLWLMANWEDLRYRIALRANKLEALFWGLDSWIWWGNWDTMLVDVENNVYNHFVVTVNWATIKIYKNWELAQTSTKADNFATSWTTSLIWCEPDSWDTGGLGNWFPWILDEIWIWDEELTQDDVTTLYNSWSWLSYNSFTS